MSADRNRRILIVDDESAVVDYLCESLAAHGFEPVGTTSSLEALARIKKEDFDLVISDVEMPELRGVDLLSSILDAKPTQLVLLITAYGSVEMAVAAVRAGACDFSPSRSRSRRCSTRSAEHSRNTC
jgi:DNA-binding NtrC family response regulator